MQISRASGECGNDDECSGPQGQGRRESLGCGKGFGPRTSELTFRFLGSLDQPKRGSFRTRKVDEMGFPYWYHTCLVWNRPHIYHMRSDVTAEAYIWVRPILIPIADI
jgi:hypothetical protein